MICNWLMILLTTLRQEDNHNFLPFISTTLQPAHEFYVSPSRLHLILILPGFMYMYTFWVKEE